MTTPTKQTEIIKKLEKAQTALEFNQIKFMEILDTVSSDVKEIKKFIFEGGMAKNYVTQEMFDLKVENMEEKAKAEKLAILERLKDKEIQILELKNTQTKVAWLIISAVILAVLGIILGPKITI